MDFPSELIQFLKKAERVSALTGAGVSQESGLRTFRDSQAGLWAQYRPEDLASPEAFARDPKLVWDWYAWRREAIKGVRPNPGHYALVKMEDKIPNFTLITQNVDGLHRFAGSRNVLELHGNILRSAPFLLIGVFVVLMMAVTAALPAHMVSLLRENGLGETWAIAIPASIGAIQVLGRLLLYFFEHHFDLHRANRLIPCLIPLGLAALLIAPWVGGAQLYMLVVFVVFFGMGNGMLTIVKGTAIAEYVNRDHVASLNGALGMPMALARAAAPLALGLLWTRQTGYAHGLWLMLGLSVGAITALVMAQRLATKN